MTQEMADYVSTVKAEVPQVRDDLVIDRGANDAVAWSPAHVDPTYLDPVATLMLDVFDGVASVGVLANEVADVLGISETMALDQIARIVGIYRKGRLLVSPDGDPLVEPLDAHWYVPDW